MERPQEVQHENKRVSRAATKKELTDIAIELDKLSARLDGLFDGGVNYAEKQAGYQFAIETVKMHIAACARKVNEAYIALGDDLKEGGESCE